jgi:hypothetical protein
VSRADQQIPGPLLPDTHQSPPSCNLCLQLAAEDISPLFSVIYRNRRTVASAVGMALAIQVIEQVLKRQSNSTSLHFLENFKC